MDFQALLSRLPRDAISSPISSYDCPACRDTGWVERPDRAVAPCACVRLKAARERIRASGLGQAIETLTFDRFRAEEDWQRAALETVKKWLDETEGWLFLGGAAGSGKTHLCTAACGELLRRGVAVRYMLWPEEARQLKGLVNDAEAYGKLLRPLQMAEVLYIDDLFKVQRSGGVAASVTPADVRVAFELLDARYRARRATIISCEWLMDELLQVDEALFSRVYERSRGFCVQIARKGGRNARLRA